MKLELGSLARFVSIRVNIPPRAPHPSRQVMKGWRTFDTPELINRLSGNLVSRAMNLWLATPQPARYVLGI